MIPLASVLLPQPVMEFVGTYEPSRSPRLASNVLRQDADCDPVPPLLTQAEFENDLAPKSLVEGLIYEESTNLLTGASKVGKTWFALQLAMCLASGKEFLGLQTRKASVLYICLELSAGMLRERMKRIASDTGIPYPVIGERFHVVAPTSNEVPALNLSGESGFNALRKLIDRTNAQLMVADTLYRFLPGVDPNDNGAMGKVFGRLNEAAQSTGCALLPLDHVAKGEHLGPVSHSAIGASVKGGASRVIVNIKQTDRNHGGRWALDVESHFGSWEQPLHYERPLLPDGTRGGGCVLCSATQAYGLSLNIVESVFTRFATPDDTGRPHFPSKNKLTEGLISARHATGNGDGANLINAIIRDFCVPKGAPEDRERPIETSEGRRKAVVFTWRRGAGCKQP